MEVSLYVKGIYGSGGAVMYARRSTPQITSNGETPQSTVDNGKQDILQVCIRVQLQRQR